MSGEDNKTKSAGHDFRERGTVVITIEPLEHRFTAKVAAMETYEE